MHLTRPQPSTWPINHEPSRRGDQKSKAFSRCWSALGPMTAKPGSLPLQAEMRMGEEEKKAFDNHVRCFLDASSHLYKRVCPSVRPSVRPLVGPSVGPLRLCKNRDFRLFLATMRSYIESTERQTCFESVHYYS